MKKNNSSQYWLLKSEPSTFSLEDLIHAPSQTTPWDGVRNYQARNYLRLMQKGDLAFFYHSSCAIPAIVGIVTIVSSAQADVTAFNPTSPYFDSKSTPQNPRWYSVEVQFKQKLASPIPLGKLKQNPLLQGLPLIAKGNRLSVMPLSTTQWSLILNHQELT